MPDDAALADQLMKDLAAQGVDVNALAADQPATPAKAAPVAKPKGPGFKLSLPKISLPSFGKKATAATATAAAVTTIDPNDTSVEGQVKRALLTINEKEEYVEIWIKKRTALMSLGTLLVIALIALLLMKTILRGYSLF